MSIAWKPRACGPWIEASCSYVSKKNNTNTGILYGSGKVPKNIGLSHEFTSSNAEVEIRKPIYADQFYDNLKDPSVRDSQLQIDQIVIKSIRWCILAIVDIAIQSIKCINARSINWQTSRLYTLSYYELHNNWTIRDLRADFQVQINLYRSSVPKLE